MNNNIIHLSEHHGDASPGSAIPIKVEDLKAYHSSLLEIVYLYERPTIKKTLWDTIEFTVLDPFSNNIVFYENQS